MWDSLGLVGLLAGQAALLLVLVVALLRVSRSWAVLGVLTGLLVFLVMTRPLSQGDALLSTEGNGTPEAPGGLDPRCFPAPGHQEAMGEIQDGLLRYRLALAGWLCQEPWPGDSARPLGMVIVVENTGNVRVELDPWARFWLVPLPLGLSILHGPQPQGISLLDGNGPHPLASQESLWLEPGGSHRLLLIFSLNAAAQGALVKVEHMQAFTIQFSTEPAP